MEALQKALQELWGARLMANPGKCMLAQKETQYFGFQVGQRRIQLLADKIQDLNDYKQPRTKKAGQILHGSWKFIPHFSKIVKSFRGTTKCNVICKIKWNPAGPGSI